MRGKKNFFTEEKKGVIAIEAALVLPLFVFLLLALTNYIRLMIVYDNVNSGINSSVKIMSKYSYLAEATGLRAYGEKINTDPKESMKDWVKITGIFGDEDINSLEDAINNFDPSTVTPEALEELFADDDFQSASMTLVMTMLNHGLSGDDYDTVFEGIMSEGLKGFSKSGLRHAFIGGKDKSKFDDAMKAYGVKKKDGEYFNFDGTVCKVGTDDDQITVVVSYDYSFTFLGIEVTIPVSQRVSVVPWFGA